MKVDPASPFAYKTLQGDLSIRLIDLHPASEWCSDLRCDIIHIDLLDEKSMHPPYAALSYAWGSNETTSVLSCGSTRIPITASLDAALRAIRKPSWNFLVWADAVCINQLDMSERNAQVANMIHVYSKASSVLVWTGEDDIERNGAKCLEWLQYIGRHHFIALQSDIGPPEMNLLEAFFNKDWFKRRWVLQEAAVAAHAFVICGAKRINWYDFIEGVAVLRVRHDTTTTASYHESLGKLCMIETLNKSFRLAGTKSTTCDRPTLLQILFQFETSLCSDARDRVFSLMRLAALDEPDLEALSSSLDYSLTTERIYKIIADVLLKASDHYTLLHFSAAFRSNEATQSTLPSWVPDWRFRCRFRPLLHPDFKFGLGEVGEVSTRADGGINIRGCIYDYLATESQSALESKAGVNDIVAISEKLIERDISAEVDVLRTRADPRFGFLWKAEKDFANHFTKLIQTNRLLESAAQEFKASPDEHARQAEALAITRSGDVATRLANPYEHVLESQFLRGRKLFATRKGKIGIGPSDAQNGDAIVVLYGTRTPFILRENATGRKWSIVGDAYVSGITKEPVWLPQGSTEDFVIT